MAQLPAATGENDVAQHVTAQRAPPRLCCMLSTKSGQDGASYASHILAVPVHAQTRSSAICEAQSVHRDSRVEHLTPLKSLASLGILWHLQPL